MMIRVREFSTFEASLSTFWGFESDCKFLKMRNTFPTRSLSAHLPPQTSISQVQKPSLPFSLKPKAINPRTSEVTVKDELNHPGFFSPPLCIHSNSEAASPNFCSVTIINCNGFLIFFKKRILELQVTHYCSGLYWATYTAVKLSRQRFQSEFSF